MSNNKIIFLVIPSLEQGGAERVMSELANSFAKYENVQLHLALLTNAENFYPVDDKIIIHKLGFVNNGILLKKLAEIRTFIRLRILIQKYKPNVIMSFMEKYNAFTILAAAFTGISVYISDRSNPYKQFSFQTESLRKLTYKYASGIIAQTDQAKKVLGAKIKNKNIIVIHNPLKKISYYPEVQREKIILNVGRLVVEKGQKFLIEAFAKLDVSDWKLVILGDGPLKSELNTLINNLNIRENVLLPGAVKNVDFWLAKSSIFAFPSISEGYPNALVEAMGAGLPCVSFDCNVGPRDIINHNENGFLIDVGDIESLGFYIKKLIHDPSLRESVGKKAKDIQNKLSVEKISKEYFDFIVRP